MGPTEKIIFENYFYLFIGGPHVCIVFGPLAKFFQGSICIICYGPSNKSSSLNFGIEIYTLKTYPEDDLNLPYV